MASTMARRAPVSRRPRGARNSSKRARAVRGSCAAEPGDGVTVAVELRPRRIGSAAYPPGAHTSKRQKYVRPGEGSCEADPPSILDRDPTGGSSLRMPALLHPPRRLALAAALLLAGLLQARPAT